MTIPRAADLPVGRVIADDVSAWIKRGHDSWRATFGSDMWDSQMDSELGAGAQILRVGDGSDR